MKIKLNVPAYIPTTPGGPTKRTFGEVEVTEEMAKELAKKGFKFDTVSKEKPKKKKNKKKKVQAVTNEEIEV